jgi:hypothetical protein
VLQGFKPLRFVLSPSNQQRGKSMRAAWMPSSSDATFGVI